MYPRPETISSEKNRVRPVDMNAPPIAMIMLPTITAIYCVRYTLMPSVSDTFGFSPMERRFRPLCVLNR